jgi:RHS repeat-associated protein
LEFFINGRGERLEYKYDNKDLLTYAAGTFYTHDQNGNILTVANENGTTKREYDKNDRVTKFTDVNGNAIGYTYDEAGNLIKLTYPAGEVVSYAYDALNRLTAVTDYNGRVTKYEYDKNSRLVKTTRPDGSVEEITYDRAGRMTAKIDKAADGELINQYEFTYNANGDIIEEKDLQGNRTTPIKAESTEMTYGAANRLETVNGQVVSYDADGNMIKGVLGGDAASFGYDKFNRLIRVSAEETENAENTTVYKYDGEGNRISVNNNGEITVFVTDPTGSLSNLLESRNPDGSKTIYVYGVGLISQEQVTAGVVGKAAKATPENTTEYRLFHYDYRGSTTALTDADGNVTDRVIYSPYGKIDERTGETDTRFLYVGQFGVQVDENGLYYMRARYYNVDINRFMQEDLNWNINNMIYGDKPQFQPFGLSTYTPNINSVRQSTNLYQYALSNPIVYYDLSGNVVETVFDVVSTAWSAWDLIREPSWENAGFLALDVFGLVVPFLPSTGKAAKMSVKAASKVDDVIDGAKIVAKNIDEAADIVKGTKSLDKVGEAAETVKKSAENITVYISKNADGITQYAGITNDLARRQAEHLLTKGINIQPLMTGLSRADARSVEQALIEIHKLGKNGGTLINRINSIAKTNPIYANSLKRGYELLKSINYK